MPHHLLQPYIIGNSWLGLGISWEKKSLNITLRISWPHRKDWLGLPLESPLPPDSRFRGKDG